MLWKRIFLALIFCCGLAKLFGQGIASLQTYVGEIGTSHRSVSSIARDKDGFMWFGTWNGINRYDGKVFKTFDANEGSGRLFPETRRVVQVQNTTQDRLWILTYDKQVYWFDKRREEFHRISDKMKAQLGKLYGISKIVLVEGQHVWLETEGHGLLRCSQREQDLSFVHVHSQAAPAQRIASNKINFVHKGRNAKIYIGTAEGLSVVERSGEEIQIRQMPLTEASSPALVVAEGKWGMAFVLGSNRVLLSSNGQSHALHLPTNRINALLFSSHGAGLYATGEDGCLFRIDLQHLTVDRILDQDEALATMFEDSKGNLWIDQGYGVLFLERNSNKATSFYPRYKERDVIVPFFCWEDVNERVWISMRAGGFGYYDDNKKSMQFTRPSLGGEALDLPQYNSHFFYDNTGVAWFTSEEKGLVKMVFPKTNFAYHELSYLSNPFLKDEVRSLLTDAKGRLWVGTKTGAIHVLEGDKTFMPMFDSHFLAESKGIYSMLEDQSGHIWIGTKGAGLYRAIPNQKGMHRFESFFRARKGEKAEQVYALALDKQQNVWVGTFESGLYMLEQGFGEARMKHVPWSAKAVGNRSFKKIRHLLFDAKGNLWVATTEGLVVHSPTGETRFFYDSPSGANILGDNDIQHIFADATGKIYLCTSGGGLTEVQGDPFGNIHFVNYGKQEGLHNGFIISGMADAQGDLWLSTEGGLIKFDTKAKKFFSVDSGLGFQGVSFSEKAVSRSSSNRIFWGTRNGILAYDTEGLKSKRSDATMVLTRLMINNAEHSMNQSGEQFDVQYLERLKLPYNQNNLSIDFAVTDFQSNQYHFAYRLLGLDSAWHRNGNINRATFTNLKPGEYVFQVRCENDFYKTTPFRSIVISIFPPWWATWWAYTLYVGLGLLFVVFGNRFIKSLWLLKQKVVIEQKLAEVKLQFFTNVSHELRTPLTLILSPAAQLSKRWNASAEEKQYLALIIKNAERMQRFVDQLLDLRQIQDGKYKLNKSSVDLIALGRQVIEGFSVLARERDINLKAEFSQSTLILFIDKDGIETVLYNLLSNALKYTYPNTDVVLRIDNCVLTKAVEVAVLDEGPGVDDKLLPHLFELFYVGERHSEISKSSGIGLHFTAELIDLHQGRIEATNRKEGGLQVAFTLPADEKVTLAMEAGIAVISNKLKDRLSALALDSSPQLSVTAEKEELLLVEDNAELRAYLLNELAPSYRVIEASRGDDGLAMALEKLPDLIVSDVMMPGLDGIELVRQLRAEERSSHIPIILLSAKHAVETQIEGLDYGADYYITKPFHLDVLLVSIRNLLRKRRQLFERMVNQKELLISQDQINITDQDSKFLRQVIHVVEQKMVDPNLNIDTLADAMNLGRNTFYKKFKSLTDMTPVEFVRDMRLEKAKIMLDQGKDNISEVAYAVGFNNPKYFSTCFRDKFGTSPKSYVLQKG